MSYGVYDAHTVMTRTNVHLTEHQLAALRAIAKASGLSVAEEIRRAIDAYVKSNRPRQKDQTR